jgi:hypothetical protein
LVMETPKKKPCKVCGEVKDIDLFYRHAAHCDGHFGKCKACYLAAAKARRERDIEAARAKGRERYRKLRDAAGRKEAIHVR